MKKPRWVSSGARRESRLDALLTTKQVAERLQITVGGVRGAIRDGRLQAFLPAGRRAGYRITEAAVQRWLTETRAR